LIGKKIYYSIFEDNSWSLPTPISDENFPDSSPIIKFDRNDNAVVTWIRCNNSSINKSFPIEKIEETYDIFTSYWNKTSNQWSPVHSLSNNNKMDFGLSLNADNNGNIYAGWYTDDDSNSFTTSNRDVIIRSWDGNAWSDSMTVANDRNIISHPIISNFYDGLYVFWVEFNNDLVNSEQILCYSELNGESWSIPKILTHVNGNIINPSLVSLNNIPHIIWAENGKGFDDQIMISSFESGWSVPTKLLSYSGTT
jgi:hypothetical protein